MLMITDARSLFAWFADRSGTCPSCRIRRGLIEFSPVVTSTPRDTVTFTCPGCGYVHSTIITGSRPSRRRPDLIPPYWPSDPSFDRKRHRWSGEGCICGWTTGRSDWDEHARAEAFDAHALDIQQRTFTIGHQLTSLGCRCGWEAPDGLDSPSLWTSFHHHVNSDRKDNT